MIGIISVFVSLFSLISAFELNADKSHKRCDLELQGIVHQPETAGLRYLESISRELKCAGQLLWTPYNVSTIENFEQKFTVVVNVWDAFGNIIYPAPIINLGKSMNAALSYTNVAPEHIFFTTAHANLNTGAFDLNTGTELMSYEYIQYSTNGELKYVVIYLPSEAGPLLKK